jgi:hypothetical protein
MVQTHHRIVRQNDLSQESCQVVAKAASPFLHLASIFGFHGASLNFFVHLLELRIAVQICRPNPGGINRCATLGLDSRINLCYCELPLCLLQ